MLKVKKKKLMIGIIVSFFSIFLLEIGKEVNLVKGN